MTKKEYSRWINQLAASEDPDTADIGRQAQQAAWVLDGIYNAADLDEFTAERGIETVAEFEREVKEGWISVHGNLIATWYDGLL